MNKIVFFIVLVLFLTLIVVATVVESAETPEADQIQSVEPADCGSSEDIVVGEQHVNVLDVQAPWAPGVERPANRFTHATVVRNSMFLMNFTNYYANVRDYIDSIAHRSLDRMLC